MKSFKSVLLNMVLTLGLCGFLASQAVAADIQVYKGVLRVLIPDQQDRQSLLLQYRTKTREVLGIGISGLSLTNMATKKVTRLEDRSVRMASQLVDGYWSSDIVYSDLNLAGDDYRVTGRITFFMARSQQSRNFSVYLKPASNNRPFDSSIDWGVRPAQ